MELKFGPESGRRIAYTDRIAGYFEYQKGCENNGYYRQNKRFFNDITVGGYSISLAKEFVVKPEGFTARFEKVQAQIALLIDEQAFYIKTKNNAGIQGLCSKLVEKEDSREYKTDTKLLQKWTYKKTEDGLFVTSNSSGVAIASTSEFHTSINQSVLELHLNNLEQKEIEWYISFEETEASAIKRAVRLAKENAINAHTEKVLSFINQVQLDTGNARFDDAFKWARFSGWLLATKDHGSSYRGIWAGLPWFRDNWGRDTFISINGTLLSSGCFEEARDVLMGFAGFQDKDKESDTYGRIPNRYRDEKDVIYNTADGTLWFIRALWEYVQYAGDFTVFEQLLPTVELALDADIARADDHGFLKHGDADTWMDARLKGENPLSPRGDRANDIQALWFTALRLGALMEERAGNKQKSSTYTQMAEKVRKSFIEFFWDEEHDAMADHLPAGGLGEWAKDFRVRPNQLFAITVPSILPHGKENYLLPIDIADKIVSNVDRELVNPFGLYSLSPEDPLFHPEHENPEWYHKDAAYHNGTIWEWNSGPYISASAHQGNMNAKAYGIIQNEAKMIMDYGCAGSLSENIHARPDANGNPKLSGTFSQAWSVAEYVRNIAQDLVGFVPRLAEGVIEINPHFPCGLKNLNARIPFGQGWNLILKIQRKPKEYRIYAEWECGFGENFAQATRITLKINNKQILPNKSVEFVLEVPKYKGVPEKFGVPEKWTKIGYDSHELSRPWCAAERDKDYLFNLLKSGRMNFTNGAGENTGALEWYFDSPEFEKEYTTNLELGAIYTKKKTTFRLWAPTSVWVKVLFYKDGTDSPVCKEIPLKRRTDGSNKGVWEVTVKGDLHGTYYRFKNMVFGVQNIFSDPYAKACGVNGNRSMVVDFERTNPDGWQASKSPEVKSPSDVVAYEAHIADITSSPNWNGQESLKRTYLGACKTGTQYRGMPTGFDYIKKLGITHIQFLPFFDFRSVDETQINNEEYKSRPTYGNFNWGYDPENYGVPEGSYSTDPYHGEVRIKECKQMIKAYNDAGIGVVMDVVFNHVNDGLHHGLGLSVPGYFYRVEAYSGAGEDTASERSMFRKYMVDMLCFWLKEYKLAGFRFDLMGLHDVKTMNEIKERLCEIKKDVLIYGEGWDMYHAGKMTGASQVNSAKMNEIGLFNDAVRCAIKGPLFEDTSKGFIHNGNRKESVKFGIVGATEHPQVDYKLVEGTAYPKPWSTKTWVSLNYTEIHDNITLYDKNFLTEPDKAPEYYEQLQKMAISLVLLSEGFPILHAGMEFMRTKEIPQDYLQSGATFYDVAYTKDTKRAFLRNSYSANDRINNLDWTRALEKKNVVDYVKNLIALRKEHPCLRLSTQEEVSKRLVFIDNAEEGLAEPVLAWTIDASSLGDDWSKALIIANPLEQDISYTLPASGTWKCITDGTSFDPELKFISAGEKVSVKAKGVVVFAQFCR
ncbi:MAG: type I pullulanase [Treponema sp.]|nr:type I pullulanase [Treponema sp.]